MAGFSGVIRDRSNKYISLHSSSNSSLEGSNVLNFFQKLAEQRR